MAKATKANVVEFLKEEHKRIEDVLYELGEIEEVASDAERKNIFIQDQFRDALMIFNKGDHEYLRDFLGRMSKKKWL